MRWSQQPRVTSNRTRKSYQCIYHHPVCCGLPARVQVKRWITRCIYISDQTSHAAPSPPCRTIITTQFASHYTLRFPRVVALRWDKGYGDILTDKQLEQLVRENNGKHGERSF